MIDGTKEFIEQKDRIPRTKGLNGRHISLISRLVS